VEGIMNNERMKEKMENSDKASKGKVGSRGRKGKEWRFTVQIKTRSWNEELIPESSPFSPSPSSSKRKKKKENLR
jgi:hypothetical protein